MPRTRLLAGPAAAAIALALAGGATASGSSTLEQRLAAALETADYPSVETSALAVDLRSGRPVFSDNPLTPLHPASNEKLAVSFAALLTLGPDYRIATTVVGSGRQEGAVWRGNLLLVGRGDPTLSNRDVRRLARRIRARGIRRVTGRVLGDESWFDARRTAPGWKPSFYVKECPPLSALTVDRATLDGHSSPKPALGAAVTLNRALRQVGVSVHGPPGTGRAPATVVLLASTLSPPLEQIVHVMDVESDNFTAELLLKQLGRIVASHGTTAAGARVVRNVLARHRVPLGGVRIVDGSGLSRLDRMTARTLVAILVRSWNDRSLRQLVFRALPIAGRNGTLAHRMLGTPASGRVRAKTGSTDLASALSGYAVRRYAFAVLENGDPVPWLSAEDAQDAFAETLVAAAQ